MELTDGRRDVVDPEVRAYVSSLVTALGGTGSDEDGRYVLGDDALACLRDLKKWLKLYDEKANRLDVARCLAQSNLVGGDLLQILASWPENATEDRLKSKIALACLELLVPLTWPLEKDTQQMTMNHHRHIPYLQIAQLGYKRAIVNYDGARILHTAVRCALPSMAEPLKDRSTRDEGIIKLVLYFIRNIAMIAPPPNVRFEGDEAEISRSTTIDAFDYQDILHLLLTLSSNMGEEFNTQDVIILDILFHLIKGVDVNKVFEDADSGDMDELVKLRKKEAAMLRSYEINAPTRHNRFGAMAWMHREDAKTTTISGQSAMGDSTKSLAKMDSTKKFKPPRRALKGESGPLDFDTPAMLTAPATKHLRTFVEDFLDAGFNPLFNHLRKAIDREAERIMEYHPRQFFYLVSWFLEAERVRRKGKKPAKRTQKPEDLDSFSIIASVLNQEMFVTLNRAMESSFENKSWWDLSAAMKCFTQILLTVQEMSESSLEEDQEIAENILSRIFYEETTHDRVANITRTYKDQGFGYLDSCTELAHHYLRILEQYSKQNVDLQVRSKRRIRRKKKAAKDTAVVDVDNDNDDGSDAEDEADAVRTSNERKFDFKRFSARFLTQGCVDTFVKFTTYFRDLKPAQLKRSHRFFYRVAFKQDMSVMLFRVDIIALLHKMIKGPEGLDPQSGSYKEWDELVRQILRKCVKKVQERPELVVEMLFSKINSTAHYLEYGYEKQVATSKPRAATELEVKGGKEWEEQIAIVVGAMLDRNEAEHLRWIKEQLTTAETERRSWENANKALEITEKATETIAEERPAVEPEVLPTTEVDKPVAPSILVKADNSTRKIAMFKNGHLRLLMQLVGFRCLGDVDNPEGTWHIPSQLSADQLNEALELIKKAEFSPPVFDDGQEAGDFIRRVSAGTAAKKKSSFGEDGDDDEEELLFEPGGPTAMKKSDALDALKKKRRLRRKEGSEGAEDRRLTHEQLEARAAARRERDREKNRKIKSELFVHSEDDATDEERDRVFFEQEEKIRQRANATIVKDLLAAAKEKKAKGKKTASRKERLAGSSSEHTEDEDEVLTAPTRRKRPSSDVSSDSEEAGDLGRTSARSSSAARDNVLEESGDENDDTDTPLSSPHMRPSGVKRQKMTHDVDEAGAGAVNSDESLDTGMQGVSGQDSHHEDEEDEDEDAVPVAKRARQRTRAGFIVDSSDEE